MFQSLLLIFSEFGAMFYAAYYSGSYDEWNHHKNFHFITKSLPLNRPVARIFERGFLFLGKGGGGGGSNLILINYSLDI